MFGVEDVDLTDPMHQQHDESVSYRNVFVTTDTFVTRDTHRKGGFEGRKNIRLLCFVTTDTQVKHLQSPKV